MSKIKGIIFAVIIWCLSALVSWMTSPYYLSMFPFANSVLLKIGAFILVGVILTIIVKKKIK